MRPRKGFSPEMPEMPDRSNGVIQSAERLVAGHDWSARIKVPRSFAATGIISPNLSQIVLDLAGLLIPQEIFARRILAPHPFGAYAKIRSRRIFPQSYVVTDAPFQSAHPATLASPGKPSGFPARSMLRTLRKSPCEIIPKLCRCATPLCAPQSCFACVPAQAFHGLSVCCSIAAHPASLAYQPKPSMAWAFAARSQLTLLRLGAGFGRTAQIVSGFRRPPKRYRRKFVKSSV